MKLFTRKLSSGRGSQAPPPPDPQTAPPTPPVAVPSYPPSREETIGAGVAWTARWSLRLAAIVLGAVLLGYVIRYAWVILFPVLMALVLCTVLSPVARFLRTKAHLPNALAAAATLLGAVAIVVAVGFTIAPSVAAQSGDIVDSASDGLERVQEWVQESDFVSKEQIDAALQALQERLAGSASSIASGVLTGVSAVTNGVINLVLVLILSFLFLKDGRRFLPWVGRLAGHTAGHHLQSVGQRAWDTLGGFIRTQALVSLIDAVLIGGGLLLIGVPLAVPLAIITFFAGFIPIVGAFASGLLAVLIALVSNGTTGALLVLALVVAVQQLEGNVLSPFLQSKSMDLHAAVVLLAVTLGGTLFGVTGAFFAVPVTAVLAVVVRYLDDVVTQRSRERPPPAVAPPPAP
ncbi:AI-2E family transporter [Nocardioides sp. zg-1228]|uniref:AI-2E family transporter n=1 Tax=Nocardioides sp. zg-1228 TaxID=2763008 RepID=UPI0016432A23|nr:AI-2E family transporter [Nocardioides sp. zg-1228]MBC2931958.1 AI-2E family transporter [Nocardioides sp. zg-1228]QSF57513.1 AI-2E family transporter [Nocardioides sp. zg-1228]